MDPFDDWVRDSTEPVIERHRDALLALGLTWNTFQRPNAEVAEDLVTAGFPHPGEPSARIAARDVVAVAASFLVAQRRREETPLAIFWDLENVHIPAGSDARDVVSRLRTLMQQFGTIAQFRAYCSVTQTFGHKNEKVRSELQLLGVHVLDTPHNNRKEVADKMILVDAMKFAYEHPAGAALCFITGDTDYTYLFSTLQQHPAWRVILVCKGSMMRTLLHHAVPTALRWETDVLQLRHHLRLQQRRRGGGEEDATKAIEELAAAPLSQKPTAAAEEAEAAGAAATTATTGGGKARGGKSKKRGERSSPPQGPADPPSQPPPPLPEESGASISAATNAMAMSAQDRTELWLGQQQRQQPRPPRLGDDGGGDVDSGGFRVPDAVVDQSPDAVVDQSPDAVVDQSPDAVVDQSQLDDLETLTEREVEEDETNVIAHVVRTLIARSGRSDVLKADVGNQLRTMNPARFSTHRDVRQALRAALDPESGILLETTEGNDKRITLRDVDDAGMMSGASDSGDPAGRASAMGRRRHVEPDANPPSHVLEQFPTEARAVAGARLPYVFACPASLLPDDEDPSAVTFLGCRMFPGDAPTGSHQFKYILCRSLTIAERLVRYVPALRSDSVYLFDGRTVGRASEAEPWTPRRRDDDHWSTAEAADFISSSVNSSDGPVQWSVLCAVMHSRGLLTKPQKQAALTQARASGAVTSRSIEINGSPQLFVEAVSSADDVSAGQTDVDPPEGEKKKGAKSA